jgi:erythromycin esterase-like protein
MRARVTKRLIEEKGFNFVASEADWPDAARIDHYVRHRDVPPSEWTAFARFPTWMWRNVETRNFVDWLHKHNATRAYDRRPAFYGLDLCSLYNSVRCETQRLSAPRFLLRPQRPSLGSTSQQSSVCRLCLRSRQMFDLQSRQG